jgi:thiamine-monophosphate kinase
MTDGRKTLLDVGEQGLLQHLRQFCPAGVIGDDAAVLSIQPGKQLVATTDMLVDGVHFSDRTTSAFDVGWRAAAANLSDLAAMGASPIGITVGLGLPGDLALTWIDELYQGLVACLQPYQTSILGGDTCRSLIRTVAITALGDVEPHRVIRRSTAQPDDAIVVTGVHGASRAGLELLLHPELGHNLTELERSQLIQAHQRPRPRLDVIPLLWEVVDQGRESLAIAGMDSSDGLADAVLQICRASGVGAELDCRSIPRPSALDLWVTPAQRLDWVLYGGEDFELVLCLPCPIAQALVERLGPSTAIVGQITSNPSIVLIDANNNSQSGQTLDLKQGFQHF